MAPKLYSSTVHSTFMHVQILHACAHVASVEGMGLHAQNVGIMHMHDIHSL